MFNMNVKLKFIELKASGLPIYKIANELGVHRATLMRWNKELAPYIMISRQDLVDEMLFENNCMRLQRVQKISGYLSYFYELLDSDKEKKELNFIKVLETISKLTRLLMIENNVKGAEYNLAKYEDFLNELPDDKNDFDTTVWVTDKEKFVRYEPDDEIMNMSEDKLKAFADDIIQKKSESGGLANSSFDTVQDISDKSPEVQNIFNKSFKRRFTENEKLKTEKCNDNVTMRAKDLKERKAKTENNKKNKRNR